MLVGCLGRATEAQARLAETASAQSTAAAAGGGASAAGHAHKTMAGLACSVHGDSKFTSGGEQPDLAIIYLHGWVPVAA